jgi:hypothetical protein
MATVPCSCAVVGRRLFGRRLRLTLSGPPSRARKSRPPPPFGFSTSPLRRSRAGGKASKQQTPIWSTLLIGEFEASLEKYPPVKAGTPDTYTPTQ